MARGISVLVVGASLEMSIPLLAGTGFRANLCPVASCALRMLNNQRYQVVLIGLDVPEMKGMKFVNYVRERFPEVALVVVTKPDDLRSAMLAMISGASGYIQTPLRPETVCSSLKSALKRKRLESALSVFIRRRLSTCAAPFAKRRKT